MLDIDLHSHSRVSDGILTPADLVERAYRNGATMMALTDHDEVGGIPEAKEGIHGYVPHQPEIRYVDIMTISQNR